MDAFTSRTSTRGPQTSVASSFDHWRELIGASFVPLVAQCDNAVDFEGRMRSLLLDGVSMVEVRASGHEVHRTASLIAQSEERYFKLTLQLEGTGLLIQDNREAVLRPGDLAVYDTSRPYSVTFEGQARLLVVMFPHYCLSIPSEHVARLAGIRMSGDAALPSIVGRFLAQVAENLDSLGSRNSARLAGTTLDLISTMFHEQLDMAHEEMSHHSLLSAAVCEYIEANLADPALSPASIAAAHFISIRHLHNVFHESGTTVASRIRSRRLERARRDLRDPLLTAMSVSTIAARWGFLEAAHFSRIFREAFGESPRQCRLGACAG